MLLLLTLALLGPVEADDAANARPGRAALAFLLGVEVDDLERDTKRQHETVLASRQRLATAQRMAQRGFASVDAVEQEAADARFQEAREAEMTSVRILKAYQRDVLTGDSRPDARKEYELVLDVLKSQEATARVESDFREFKLKQALALSRRGVLSRPERDTAELEAANAQASVALLKVRQAGLALAHARRPGADRAEADEVPRLELAHLRALVEHETLAATVARSRFEQARDRGRPAATPAELEALQKVSDEATGTLAADRKRLARAEAEAGPVPEGVRPSPPR